MLQTLQKKLEVFMMDEITHNEETLKQHFETEKSEFLKIISENMLILDAMLREYNKKTEMHLQRN